MPLTDHDLNPATSARGRINLAYSFFEFELGPKAKENAAKYDVIFVGSTWCLDRLKERGITNGQVLIQGVDSSIFYPRPRKADGQFRVFSGGKFEWRKGQDLVIRAFAQFARTCPEAHLVCAWHNLWPQLAIECAQLAELSAQGSTLESFFEDMLMRAGIARDRFTILPQLSQEQLAEEMAQTDCGLFPNRCEGGTNLVLMEYAACGRPVVANARTGHRDVSHLISHPIGSTEDSVNKWAVQRVDDVLSGLEATYADRRGAPVTRSIPTWQQAAETVARAIKT